MAVESGAYVFRYVRSVRRTSPTDRRAAAGVPSTGVQLTAVVVWNLRRPDCSYMLEDNIVYIVMTDKSYPKRLAFGYLSDLHKAFVDELRQEHGDPGWKDAISRTDKPYAFLKFDRTMQRIRKDYADPTSNTNAARLKEELADIQNIMRRNIQEVLDRGEAGSTLLIEMMTQHR